MGSGAWPCSIDFTTLRWPGMIQKNTLALIVVAIMAPTSRKAARPANQWQASQAAMTTSSATSAPTIASPLFLRPNSRQIASYAIQNTTRKHKAAATAAPGDQFTRFLSIRYELAFQMYETVKSANPDIHVEYASQ